MLYFDPANQKNQVIVINFFNFSQRSQMYQVIDHVNYQQTIIASYLKLLYSTFGNYLSYLKKVPRLMLCKISKLMGSRLIHYC